MIGQFIICARLKNLYFTQNVFDVIFGYTNLLKTELWPRPEFPTELYNSFHIYEVTIKLRLGNYKLQEFCGKFDEYEQRAYKKGNVLQEMWLPGKL